MRLNIILRSSYYTPALNERQVECRCHTIEEAIVVGFWGRKHGFYEPQEIRVDNRDGTIDLVMPKDVLDIRLNQYEEDHDFGERQPPT